MSEDISEKSVTRAAIVHAASGKRVLMGSVLRILSISSLPQLPLLVKRADSLRSSSLGSIRCIWRRNHLLVRSGVGVRDLHVDALIASGGWRDHALILGRRRGFLLASVRPGRVVALRCECSGVSAAPAGEAAKSRSEPKQGARIVSVAQSATLA